MRVRRFTGSLKAMNRNVVGICAQMQQIPVERANLHPPACQGLKLSNHSLPNCVLKSHGTGVVVNPHQRHSDEEDKSSRWNTCPMKPAQSAPLALWLDRLLDCLSHPRSLRISHRRPPFSAEESSAWPGDAANPPAAGVCSCRVGSRISTCPWS